MLPRVCPTRPIFLAVLSGALLALAQPGPDLGPLAWVALVPLLFGLERLDDPRRAFKTGWLGGFAFWLLTLHWVLWLWPWAPGVILLGPLLLAGAFGLTWGLFAWGYVALRRRGLGPWGRLLLAPALWVLLEWARAQTRFGFAWAQVGDALYDQLPVLQLAALTGSWGLSALALLASAGLALGLALRAGRYPAVALGVVGLVGLWGLGQLNQPPSPPEDGPEELKIALVQPAIPQRVKNDPARLDEHLQLYARLVRQVQGQDQSVDVIALPESILPTLALEDPRVLDALTRWAQAHQAALIFGTFTRRDGGLFNSAVALDPEGAVTGVYDKVQLVPFSTEYFPGVGVLRALGLERWLPVGRLGVLTPGAGFQPLTLRVQSGRTVRVGTPICFESVFGRIARALVRNGAELLVVVTNDAWFGRSWALEQHFAEAVIRAVETGRYVVQVANTGISGVVDPRGRVVLRTRKDERTARVGAVRPSSAETLYVRWGDWVVALCGAIVVGLGLRAAAAGAARRGSR